MSANVIKKRTKIILCSDFECGFHNSKIKFNFCFLVVTDVVESSTARINSLLDNMSICFLYN
jgi:hypothetical protein